MFCLSYFHLDADKSDPVKLQQGVVRTNCMDNLDRTNVAQSAIAKWMLNRQLQDVGLFSTSETVDMHADFMSDFRSGASPWPATDSNSF